MRATLSKTLPALLFGTLCAVLAPASADARGHGHRDADNTAGHFDYYLVALSWSPSFCEYHPDETQQCGTRGYGFVMHGLWPQNRNGSWPHNCRSDSTPDESTIEHALAIMPSRKLIEHEWQTHGACTGLDAKGFFDLADDAFSRIKIPAPLQTPATPPQLSAAQIVDAFIAVNPGLEKGMISVQCRDGSELEEVRICLDKDNLSVKACGGRVRNSCRYGKLRIPASR